MLKFLQKKTVSPAEHEKAPAQPDGHEVFPVPEGWKRLHFEKLTFLYPVSGFVDRCTTASDTLKKVRHIRRLQGKDVTLCIDAKGRRMLCFFQSLPVFDSGDREYGSYQKLYIRKEDGHLVGYEETGGYRIDKISAYRDIRPGDSLSAYWIERARLTKGLVLGYTSEL